MLSLLVCGSQREMPASDSAVFAGVENVSEMLSVKQNIVVSGWTITSCMSPGEESRSDVPARNQKSSGLE